MEGFEIKRNVGAGLYRLGDIATGLRSSPAVQKLLAQEGLMQDLWDKILVRIVPFKEGYMWVENYSCIVAVCEDHLKNADLTTLYLDFIHELVHVMQFLKGRELRDPRYSYVNRPTEIEAYEFTLQEARRIGLSDEKLLEYLKMEWLEEEDYRRLVENLNLSKELP